ncbi:MAG TPA: hypothetical protein VG406_26450 [Isosphaeraceae bacterium]|jgi:hypothetical protein|nr:hypothetical protein [Isosphaeraceae bacterium]
MSVAEPPSRAQDRRAACLARLLRRAVLLALVARAAVAPLAIHHAGDARHGGGALVLRVCAWPNAARGVGLSDRLRWSVASTPGMARAAAELELAAVAAPLGGRVAPASPRHSPLRC